jgi:hypothetical protein
VLRRLHSRWSGKGKGLMCSIERSSSWRLGQVVLCFKRRVHYPNNPSFFDDRSVLRRILGTALIDRSCDKLFCLQWPPLETITRPRSGPVLGDVGHDDIDAYRDGLSSMSSVIHSNCTFLPYRIFAQVPFFHVFHTLYQTTQGILRLW